MVEQDKWGRRLLSDADLSRMSVHDLWCLEELYQQISSAALSFCNQPRVEGLAADYADPLWDDTFNGTLQRIVAELERRRPADEDDIRHRATVLIRWEAVAGEFTRVIAIAAVALRDLEAAKRMAA